MKNKVLSKRLFIYFIAAFFLAIFSFAIYSLVSGVASLAQMEGWDGVSVATSFSKGNGTVENPYVIQDASEFIYFKKLIEGDESSFYQDKYYKLEEDINFNGNAITPIGILEGEEERFFAGHLDGNGYALQNFKITEGTVIGDKEYYSLFTKTKNAFISSLGLVNFRIEVPNDESDKVVSAFIGDCIGVEINSEEESDEELEVEIPVYKNIYLKQFYLDLSKTSSEHSTVGVLISNIVYQALVKNVFLQGEVNANHDFSSIPFVQDSLENIGNVSTIITNMRVINGVENVLSYSGIQDAYFYEDGVFYNQLDEAVASETVLSFLNDDIGEDCYWTLEDQELVIHAYQKVVMASSVAPINSKGFTFSLRSAGISLHDTGLDGSTVYINDLTADYNYYMGLNYTQRSNGTIPTTTSQNLYNNENLLAVYIAYRGTEINSGSTITGYVSLSEQYSDFVYYKYYPIDNGYVTIPLIDNPYGDRPDGRAFNGWVTDYDGAVVSLDMDTYTRYVKFPVSDTTPVSITMYASWTEATVANSATASNLKSVQMVPIGTRTPVFNNLPSTVYSYNSMSSGTSSQGVSYPSGAVGGNGNSLSNQRCTRIDRWTPRTCYYYLPVATADIVDGGTYYQLLNGTMRSFVVAASSYTMNTFLATGDVLAGYFRKGVPAGSLVGYYNGTGVIQTSGSCSGTNCNNYYELMQYDATNTFDPDTNYDYYYLVTRDTNIVFLNSNISGFSNTVPITVTGINNGSNHTNYRVDLSSTAISAGADLRIEYCALYTGEIEPSSNGPSNTTSDYVYGNFYNLKIGRGMPISTGTYQTGSWWSGYETHEGTYFNAFGVVGGRSSGTGTSGSPTKYSLIVESGFYNAISTVSTVSSSATYYVDAQAIYGNDFDRIQNHHNLMGASYNVASSFGGTVSSGSYTKTFVTSTFKSGTYGVDKEDTAAGVYVGGLSGGTINSPAETIIEGGNIAYLNGGPLISTNLTNYNAIYVNIKGGTVDAVFGGAARSETYGNRIINITGGAVNYGVCGGSNGIEGSNSNNNRGTLNGSTFIRIGGTGVVGTKSDSVFGIESGSVFGAGNGNTTYSEIGSVNNSTIMIADSAIITKNVYGGGNYGSVKAQSGNASTSTIIMDGGTVRGSIYGGGNNNGSGSTSVTSTIGITLNGGTVQNSIYGGSRTKGIVYGSTSVTVNGGTVTHDVYGGGEGGYLPSNDNSTPGTYVRDNVAVTVNNGTISGSVYGGSAFGTVNAINETTTTSSATTTVTINGGTIQTSVFGGGKGDTTYTPKVIGDITVTVEGGSIGNVFGGFDASGSPNAGDVVYLNGGTIGNAYGGGNKTGQTTTDIRLQGARVNNALFGGSNESGTVTTSNVTITSGIAKDVFGGNNLGGTTVTTNVTVTGGRFLGDIYGGGNEAPSTTSNILIRIAPVNDVYGGGKEAGLTTSNVTIRNASFNNMYGGSNVSGDVETSNVSVTTTSGSCVFGGNNQGGTTTTTNVDVSLSTLDIVFGGGDNATSGESHVTITGGNVSEVYGGGNEAGLTTSNVTIVDGTIGAVFGGSNQSGNITTSNITIGDPLQDPLNIDIQIDSVYGGNNYGGVTSSANITSHMGTIGQLFGGGNEASVGETNVSLTNTDFYEVYGGGNAAGVSGDTYLSLGGCTVTDSVYGGGNEGVVGGDTEVIIEDTSIGANAYAGGNGSTAIVSGDSTITIRGTSEIGTSTSVAPYEGCVFGSGNAANTGTLANNNSKATVNITGATIHGNVYGGPKMAVVYGLTEVNIGSSALGSGAMPNNSVVIDGTVFGGGESNASGSTNYDWTFISVTQGITVNIDGTNYASRNYDFEIHGSIFGSGNASSSSGTSEIYITHLGSIDAPNSAISIQRANYLEIASSAIELAGATDRTNDYSDSLYSFNIIDKMVIRDGTALLLQHNANLLKELYSGVYDEDEEEIVPATVDIDDELKTVTRNVDNRIYMIPGENLNITINQNATAYGKVTGMTFFGMYQPYEGGYRLGLYDPVYDYDDLGDAGLEIIGGSYVVGLHSVDHDITKDGFYSNYLDDVNYDKIVTAYIDPTPIGETGYRWTIGFEAINYEFTLTASKYSSLGTTELQLTDFATGDAVFSILGVDTSGLDTGISMVDSTLVPRVGRTLEQANQTLGLAMKAETQEWMGYGTTKFYSQDGGTLTGTREYRTDSRQLPPSFMFYLYHAKNISVDGPLGSVVITVQVATPKNGYEQNIDFITITANIIARQFDDGDSYDASITYDKRYEMPSSTLVNITNTSQFTAYFSLIAWNNQFSGVYGNNNENFHVLITDHVLPVNTMITMLDFGANPDRPEYYYFRVTQSVYDNSVYQLQHDNEVTYPLSQFIKMDSTSTTNTYSDSDSNLLYYDSNIGLVDEEFIFIFDFKECTQVTGDHLNNSVLFELRNNENRTVFTVLGIREAVMYYSTYESTNIVLDQTITNAEAYLYYDIPDEINYTTQVQYDETENRQSVIDTNYESSSMGLNIAFLDRDNEPVSSSLLIGTYFRINNQQYFADADGVFRIKLSDKVSNLIRVAQLNVYKTLPAGQYTIRYTLFASDDGLHNSDPANSVYEEITVTVVSSDNSLIVDCEPYTEIVDGATGLNMNNTRLNTYVVQYQSVLTNPNFRVEVYKRNTTSVDVDQYTSIGFHYLFTNDLFASSGNEVSISMDGRNRKNFDFQLQTTDNLTSGTYRVVFKLYDNNQLIDSDEKYVIVHKNLQ